MTTFDAIFQSTILTDENSVDPSIQALKQKAIEFQESESLIADLEKNLDEVKARHNEMKLVEIPKLMAQIGTDNFPFPSLGKRITVDDFVAGSLPKVDPKRLVETTALRDAAIRELERLEAANILKTVITIRFAKSQHNEALSLAQELREKGHAIEIESGVHPQTFLAWAREAMEQGKDLALKTLGLYAGKTTKLVEYKEPKRKTRK